MSIFPNFFDEFINTSIIKRAIEAKKVEVSCVDFRSYSTDKHHNVDDTPCGGGCGMLLSVQPIAECIKDIRSENSKVILLSAHGKTFNQDDAKRLSQEDELIFVCGHYEGYDERIYDYVDEQISVGDFILTGGEIGAMMIADASIRLIDGVIEKHSHEDESFENNILEYPQYTRPIDFDGKSVPEVLLSGHHKNINQWRKKEAIRKTYLLRPDLLKKAKFDADEKALLEAVIGEESKLNK